MFTGIDEVDWASLQHAYGSAEDVPGWLLGLASADPAEREAALDRMYGTVHPQGDVYDSTLACVPFLFALAGNAEVPDRGGIVELLVSIGQESGERGTGGPAESAGRAVRARAEVFAGLSGDADAAVRGAAVGAVVRFVGEPDRVLDLLRERITVERDDRVLIALAESLGRFVRRHPGHSAEALELLVAQSAAPCGPAVRLAALGRLAECAPDRLPSDLVPLAVRLLGERSAARISRPEESEAPGTDTLVGRLRRLRPSDEEGSQLVRTLHRALNDRVDDRIALLEGQLTCPDATDRCNAVWMSAALMREWRADCARLVTLIGAQLGAAQDRLRDAAVFVLTDLCELAVPAAEDLAALVSDRPDLWVRRWGQEVPMLGGPLKALALSGDPRAVPVLAEVLAGPVVPGDLGQTVRHLGRAVAPLVPVVRRGLAEIPLDSPETSARAVPLLSVLGALGDTHSGDPSGGAQEALPDVLRLVRGSLLGPRSGDACVEAAARAVGMFGSAAREAGPLLRGLLNTEYASGAARALWEVEGDATAVLPVLLGDLTGAEPRRRRSAVGALSRMGAQARPAVPALRSLMKSGHPWERATAACALWRIDGDPETVLPTLRTAWAESPDTRGTIAECLVGTGRAGAPLRDLMEAELAGRRRHLALPGRCGSDDIRKDERLLRLCRAAPAHG
ncbi:HEAT repeat domain-containing protein [Streptomyces sp. AC555_RSS877]|uniref:HEAT repeat domain-containing protein n=1 Tax=Streptomyces sp. AC555_RSS877 TaxID=2823688 RepID=UPI001C2706D7|nr:HEAT repeat domain-containing protein [Streptomyces sp. AC555_RSS877]